MGKRFIPFNICFCNLFNSLFDTIGEDVVGERFCELMFMQEWEAERRSTDFGLAEKSF